MGGSGWDGLFICGQAAAPICLYIDEQTVELRDAAPLWNLEVRWTRHNLHQRHGQDA